MHTYVDCWTDELLLCAVAWLGCVCVRATRAKLLHSPTLSDHRSVAVVLVANKLPAGLLLIRSSVIIMVWEVLALIEPGSNVGSQPQNDAGERNYAALGLIRFVHSACSIV